MTRTVLLDAAPLGLLTAPPRRAEARACSRWLAGLMAPDVVIATTNVGHLARFVAAEHWHNISP